jgi:hypothetical protein
MKGDMKKLKKNRKKANHYRNPEYEMMNSEITISFRFLLI